MNALWTMIVHLIKHVETRSALILAQLHFVETGLSAKLNTIQEFAIVHKGCKEILL